MVGLFPPCCTSLFVVWGDGSFTIKNTDIGCEYFVSIFADVTLLRSPYSPLSAKKANPHRQQLMVLLIFQKIASVSKFILVSFTNSKPSQSQIRASY
jgi:hypothetical protein